MTKFNRVELTAESMQKARDWYAENAQACIAEVERGEVRVNDKASYFEWQAERIVAALAGEFDHTLSFLQRAHFIQTGECIALLP